MKPKQEAYKKRRKEKNKKKAKAAMVKTIPILVAIVLIIAVIGIFYGQKIIDKYSYSKEFKNLYEYYELAGDEEMAVVLNDNKCDYKGVWENGVVYLPYVLIEDKFTNHFYLNRDENVLLYTTADAVYKTLIGNEYTSYYVSGEEVPLDYAPVINKGEEIYMAADYLANFVGLNYEFFREPNRVCIYTKKTEYKVLSAKKDSAIRYQGGVKSPILEEVKANETLYLMGEMEDWAQVRSVHGLVGYIEIKHYLENGDVETKDIPEPEVPLSYEPISMEGKVNMAFHQVFGEGGNQTFDEYTANVKSVNVIAPTWFRINEAGELEDISSSNYVERAHAKGMKIWAVWTDVDYKVDLGPMFHTFDARKQLIDKMISATVNTGIDGINIDFETVSSSAGEDFVEFLRELSIETHKNNLVLSVDNYAPTASTAHYNRKEQGQVADYVIIMGYDEHWASSQEAGSVASINFVENGIINTLDSVPADKVINAIPFYTRIWKTESGKVSSETVGIPIAKKWVEDHQVNIAWDNTTCQYYGEFTKGGVYYQIWLEEPESLQVKLNVMDSYSVAGVAEWKLGLESEDCWNAIEAYMLMQ